MLCVCHVTVPSRDVGLRVARQLVRSHAAACVNLIPQVTSVYRWEGEVKEDEELLLMIKTQRSCVEEVVRQVKDVHPYECPEVIATDVSGGLKPYMDWVVAQTGEGSAPPSRSAYPSLRYLSSMDCVAVHYVDLLCAVLLYLETVRSRSPFVRRSSPWVTMFRSAALPLGGRLAPLSVADAAKRKRPADSALGDPSPPHPHPALASNSFGLPPAKVHRRDDASAPDQEMSQSRTALVAGTVETMAKRMLQIEKTPGAAQRSPLEKVQELRTEIQGNYKAMESLLKRTEKAQDEGRSELGSQVGAVSTVCQSIATTLRNFQETTRSLKKKLDTIAAEMQSSRSSSSAQDVGKAAAKSAFSSPIPPTPPAQPQDQSSAGGSPFSFSAAAKQPTAEATKTGAEGSGNPFVATSAPPALEESKGPQTFSLSLATFYRSRSLTVPSSQRYFCERCSSEAKWVRRCVQHLWWDNWFWCSTRRRSTFYRSRSLIVPSSQRYFCERCSSEAKWVRRCVQHLWWDNWFWCSTRRRSTFYRSRSLTVPSSQRYFCERCSSEAKWVRRCVQHLWWDNWFWCSTRRRSTFYRSRSLTVPSSQRYFCERCSSEAKWVRRCVQHLWWDNWFWCSTRRRSTFYRSRSLTVPSSQRYFCERCSSEAKWVRRCVQHLWWDNWFWCSTRRRSTFYRSRSLTVPSSQRYFCERCSSEAKWVRRCVQHLWWDNWFWCSTRRRSTFYRSRSLTVPSSQRYFCERCSSQAKWVRRCVHRLRCSGWFCLFGASGAGQPPPDGNLLGPARKKTKNSYSGFKNNKITERNNNNNKDISFFQRRLAFCCARLKSYRTIRRSSAFRLARTLMPAVAPNIMFQGEVSTTMDAAKDLIPQHGAAPFAVAGKVQLQGRGSDGRTWVSPEGNLYFTIAIPQRDEAFLKKELVPVIPLVVGLACQRAVKQLVPGAGADLVRTKWPNDIIYNHKKLGGSIAETAGDHLLIGIGVNVHLAPPIGDDGRAPACLDEVTQAAGAAILEPPQVATAIWTQLFEILGDAAVDRKHVVAAFDAAMDKSLSLHRRTATGRDKTPLTAVSLNEWGHLTVKDPEGKEEILFLLSVPPHRHRSCGGTPTPPDLRMGARVDTAMTTLLSTLSNTIISPLCVGCGPPEPFDVVCGRRAVPRPGRRCQALAIHSSVRRRELPASAPPSPDGGLGSIGSLVRCCVCREQSSSFSVAVGSTAVTVEIQPHAVGRRCLGSSSGGRPVSVSAGPAPLVKRAGRWRPAAPVAVVGAGGQGEAEAAVSAGDLEPMAPPQRRSKFSFHNGYLEAAPRDYFQEEVPNSEPKPKLSMWASSLTHPALETERLIPFNWISQDARGYVAEADRAALERWCAAWLAAASPASEAPAEMFQENLLLHPRLASMRGVFARRRIAAGETVVALPLQGQGQTSSAWGAPLSTEALPQCSHMTFADVLRHLMSLRRSSLDPTPHIWFAEQVYLAMQLAAEAQRPESPWAPYLQLLRAGTVQAESASAAGEGPELAQFALFDDDLIKEMHRSVLEPAVFLEYADHCQRFRHMLRGLHSVWWEETPRNAAAPPPLDTLEWALRVVLSRQRVTPALRVRREAFAAHSRLALALDATAEEDWFARRVMQAKTWVYDRILGAVDHDRLRVNQVNDSDMPAIVPVLDLLQHAPGGRANTSIGYEDLPLAGPGKEAVRCAVVRAKEELDEGDELTTLFPKCYSVAYTLYRYGSLALHRREDDVAHLTEGGGRVTSHQRNHSVTPTTTRSEAAYLTPPLVDRVVRRTDVHCTTPGLPATTVIVLHFTALLPCFSLYPSFLLFPCRFSLLLLNSVSRVDSLSSASEPHTFCSSSAPAMTQRIEVSSQPARPYGGRGAARIPDQGSSKTSTYNHRLGFRAADAAIHPPPPPAETAAAGTPARPRAAPAGTPTGPVRHTRTGKPLRKSPARAAPPVHSRRSPQTRSANSPTGRPSSRQHPDGEEPAAQHPDAPLTGASRTGRTSRSRQRHTASREDGINFQNLQRPASSQTKPQPLVQA
eukprot:gene3618-2555_t